MSYASDALIDAFEQKNRRLEKVNAKLREQIILLQSEWESEKDYADQMEAKEKMAVAENERLRELCADMLTCINAYKARKSICTGCSHHRDVDELRSACFLDLDARDLGIKTCK